MSIIHPDIPAHDQNIFGCITIPTEIVLPAKELPVIDYMVKEYPRNENAHPFTFVYSLFNRKENAFAYNQEDIIDLSKSLFRGTKPLDKFEMSVLDKTFHNSIKTIPTLKGRK
jgi:hypothetical protein